MLSAMLSNISKISHSSNGSPPVKLKDIDFFKDSTEIYLYNSPNAASFQDSSTCFLGTFNISAQVLLTSLLQYIQLILQVVPNITSIELVPS